jgi:hypothetical protein
MLPALVPNNSDLREPEDTSEWPPTIVFNLFYASAGLWAWAPMTFVQAVNDANYASDDGTPDGQGEPGNTGPCIPPEASARAQCLNTQNERRLGVAHPGETQFSSAMDGVTALWMRSKRRIKGNLQTTTAPNVARDKVQAWMDSEGFDFNSRAATDRSHTPGCP